MLWKAGITFVTVTGHRMLSYSAQAAGIYESLNRQQEKATMGAAKHEMMMREDSWHTKARSEGWKCAVCGCTPPLSERDVYFDTGMCGWCAHTANKDD